MGWSSFQRGWFRHRNGDWLREREYLMQEGGLESGRKILGESVLGDGRLEVWERRRDPLGGRI